MNNVVPTIKYLAKTCEHKWFVFCAGLRTRAPINRLLIHDWTKFTPAEAPHYGRRFFGPNDDKAGFKKAWKHHYTSNPHHWEYWVRTPSGDVDLELGEAQPMPEWAVREMVADWMGAAMSNDGFMPANVYWNTRPKLKMHDETVAIVERVLGEIFPNG